MRNVSRLGDILLALLRAPCLEFVGCILTVPKKKKKALKKEYDAIREWSDCVDQIIYSQEKEKANKIIQHRNMMEENIVR